MLVKIAFGNVCKSARDFAVYFFTLVLGIAVFYAFNSIAGSDAVAGIREDSRAMVELLGMVISLVSVFIAVILAFLVIYANRFLIRRRTKEFALYLTLGMQKGDLLKISAAETLIVGAASLGAGLALGIGASQVLSNLTASLFDSEVSGVSFSISGGALLLTAGVFAAIFLVTVVLNTGHLFKAKLIDLLSAERKNEVMKLRSLPLSFALFVIACVIIAASYRLLIDNGLFSFNREFAMACALVCAGTVLFFYSVSGFLLRATQFIRPLYLRGLNMVWLRSLASRANSAFMSMSVIAITLFLAMTSVCGGIGICNALASGMEKGTKYDVSVTSTYGLTDYDTGRVEMLDLGGFGDFAAEHDWDIASGLAASAQAVGAPAWDDMVEKSAQVDFHASGVTVASLRDATGVSLYDFISASMMGDNAEEHQCFDAVALSQYNAARELAGLAPLDLGEGECALWCDFALMQGWARAVAAEQPVVAIGGRELSVLPEIQQDTLETTSVAMRQGVLVVPDECIADDMAVWTSLLDVQCKPGQQDAFYEFAESVQNSSDPNTYPITMAQSEESVRAASTGLTGIVSYLAIYIGFVLVIACAAILAIQQLTDASDNARRYELLAKLGAPDSMMAGSLFKQIAVYFAFPLLLGVAHTLCAMQVVVDVVMVFGALDIGQVSVIAVACFLAVYGAYFLATYFAARAMVRFKRG